MQRRKFMPRRYLITFISLFLFACSAFATAFGTVRGIVHDAQHRPVADSDVVLKAANSDFTKSTKTSADGDFQFDSVPRHSLHEPARSFCATARSLPRLTPAIEDAPPSLLRRSPGIATLWLQNQMAMEFARTVTAQPAEADDSWLPRGTRSFLLFGPRTAGLETLCEYCLLRCLAPLERCLATACRDSSRFARQALFHGEPCLSI